MALSVKSQCVEGGGGMVAAQSTNPHSDRVNPFSGPKGSRHRDGCFSTQEDRECISPSPQGGEGGLTMNTA